MIGLSSKSIYISLLGRSAWALLNTYYAVIREGQYQPEEVLIAVESPFKDKASSVVEGVRTISSHFGISPQVDCIPVFQADIVDAFEKLYSLIITRKKAGATVAIDITPGRKSVVAGVLLPIKLSEIDHVFYLEISTTENVAKPFQMIPRQYHRLHDFKAEAVMARDRS